MRLARALLSVFRLLRVSGSVAVAASAVLVNAVAQVSADRQVQAAQVANAPATKIRNVIDGQNHVAPAPTSLRLVDGRGGPVSGAIVAGFFWRDNDREPAFTPSEANESRKSDERGEALLELDIPEHLDGAGVYAIRQGKGRPLVGIHKVTREEVGKPITITMYPACRVLFQIDSAGLLALEKEYRAELTGPGWWRVAYLRLGRTHQAPRPLFTSSTAGKLEFLLPPGRFTIDAYGLDARSIELPVEIKPDDREVVLGTIELAASEAAKQGLFPNHRRVRLNAADDAEAIARRRVLHRSLHGTLSEVRDVAFSPDGKVVATACANRTGLAEVKLWDWGAGLQVATLTVQDQGIVRLAFSPDGKLLAGLVNAVTKPEPSPAVVLWDTATRRLVRALGEHTEGIVALALSPDGRTLASSGQDKTQLWDVASGREMARIEADGTWGQSLAFAPDGRILAIGVGHTIKFWNVGGNRPQAILGLTTETLRVGSIAYSADGRTLAAAGSATVPKKKSEEGQVWLYDVAERPVRRRAVLRFDGAGGGLPEVVPSVCSDVVFTPDGRRVIGVAIQHVRTWDVATAIEQNTFMRNGPSGLSDRLAVSPDGRWLAIVGPLGIDFVDIPPPPIVVLGGAWPPVLVDAPGYALSPPSEAAIPVDSSPLRTK
jgi:hypothetical protein